MTSVQVVSKMNACSTTVAEKRGFDAGKLCLLILNFICLYKIGMKMQKKTLKLFHLVEHCN